jgi:hypothetical protein
MKYIMVNNSINSFQNVPGKNQTKAIYKKTTYLYLDVVTFTKR